MKNLVNNLNEIFINNLYKRKPVLEYIKSRGISDKTIRKFQLGYGDNNIGYNSLKQKYSDKEFLESGLFRESNKQIFDIFYKRITIPIIKDKEIAFLTSRAFPNSKVNHLHQKGEIKYAINYDVIKKSNYIVLVEGPFDCMTLDQNGIPCIGLLGAGRISREMISDLRKKQIYICFDSEPNKTGIKASVRLAKKLISFGIKSRIVQLPDIGEKLDINKYFIDNKLYSFKKLLNEAKLFDKSTLKQKKSVHLDSSVDIVAVASKYMTLTYMGGKYKAICPFHQEKDASLVIYPETNTWYYFGCQSYGNSATIIQKFENDKGNKLSYKEASELGKTI